jgi:hypothetical protein
MCGGVGGGSLNLEIVYQASSSLTVKNKRSEVAGRGNTRLLKGRERQ